MSHGGKKETPPSCEAVAGALRWGSGALGAGPAAKLTTVWGNSLPCLGFPEVSTSSSARICTEKVWGRRKLRPRVPHPHPRDTPTRALKKLPASDALPGAFGQTGLCS